MGADEPDASSFEASIRKLGDIVQRLESGELSLEESLRAFEQGVALARAAKERLDAAEARVEELLAVDAQGRATTRSLDRATPAESRPTPTDAARPSKPPGDDDDLPF